MGAFAAVAAVRGLLRSGVAGLCSSCRYDLRSLPAAVVSCPECGRARGARRWWVRRISAVDWIGIVLMFAIAAGVAVWPRRHTAARAMPVWALLAADRLGYADSLDILAERANQGELSREEVTAFCARASERLENDPATLMRPRSNVMYVMVQWAMIGDAAARDGLCRAVRGGAGTVRSDVVRTVVNVREDGVREVTRETLSRMGKEDFLTFAYSERGRRYTSLIVEPNWLRQTLLDRFDAADSDVEAQDTLALVKNLFRSPFMGEDVLAQLECRPWMLTRSDAGKWVNGLYEEWSKK